MKTQIFVFTISAGLFAGSSTTPAEADNLPFELKDLTCFDVISQAEEDSLFLIAMLIGNASAAAGGVALSAEMLETTIENFDTVCGENPEMPAVDAMQLG